MAARFVLHAAMLPAPGPRSDRGRMGPTVIKFAPFEHCTASCRFALTFRSLFLWWAFAVPYVLACFDLCASAGHFYRVQTEQILPSINLLCALEYWVCGLHVSALVTH